MSKKTFRDLVVYEIYPTSFFDGNNDGTGDLKGITSKLKYIKETGFNAIWLNPFYVSPFRDGGYDVVALNSEMNRKSSCEIRYAETGTHLYCR